MPKRRIKRKGVAKDNRSLRNLDRGVDPGNVYRLYDIQDVGQPMTSQDRIYRIVMVKSMVNPDYNRGRVRMFRVEFIRPQPRHLHFSVGERIKIKPGKFIIVHNFIPQNPNYRVNRGINKGIVFGVMCDYTGGSTNYQVHEA